MRQFLPKFLPNTPEQAKALLHRAGLRARHWADQAGDKLGDLSNFDATKKTTIQQGIAAHNAHRSIQTIRQQLPAMFGLGSLKGSKTLERFGGSILPESVKDGVTEFRWIVWRNWHSTSATAICRCCIAILQRRAHWRARMKWPIWSRIVIACWLPLKVARPDYLAWPVCCSTCRCHW